MDRCRILTRQGAQYVTERGQADVVAEVFDPETWLFTVQTVTGCEMFPPEVLTIRTEEIMSVQSLSEENWAFQVQHETDHYRRILEATPAEQMAESQRRLVEVLAGDDDD